MTQTITLIGQGTSEFPQQSGEAQTIIQSAKQVYQKGHDKGILAQFPVPVKYVEPVINPVNGLAEAYRSLAAELIRAAPAVLLVPGDPALDEAATPIIRQLAAEAGVAVRLVGAADWLSYALKTWQIGPGNGLQILDATLMCSYHYPPLEPNRPALITGLYHPALVEPVQRRLGLLYRPHTPVKALTAAGPIDLPLAQLDESAGLIYLPAQTDSAGLTAFQETIARLRAPDGCPWDRKQTHQSLRQYLLEETHEALTAIDNGDLPELAEELGDILLQILLHAQIGTEAGAFRMVDVVQTINRKMLRRHPHVFGDVSVSGADEVVTNWAAIKTAEKAANGEKAAPVSVLDGVANTLPALAQALNISQKAVDVGFEWPTIDGVLDKLVEEAREIVTAATPAEVESEIGDFLFVVVNLARKMKVDPESALRTTNARFTRRFNKVEELARSQNLALPELDKETWQVLWRHAKQATAHLENK